MLHYLHDVHEANYIHCHFELALHVYIIINIFPTDLFMSYMYSHYIITSVVSLKVFPAVHKKLILVSYLNVCFVFFQFK